MSVLLSPKLESFKSWDREIKFPWKVYFYELMNYTMQK